MPQALMNPAMHDMMVMAMIVVMAILAVARHNGHGHTDPAQLDLATAILYQNLFVFWIMFSIKYNTNRHLLALPQCNIMYTK